MEISSKDLIKVIKRYQHCIQQISPISNDPKRVLHYIRKLAKLPIRLEELEQTGIGKTINALRKSDGKVGEGASKLVAKWKEIARKQVEDEEVVEQKSSVENGEQSDSSLCNIPSPIQNSNNVTSEPVKPEYVSNFCGMSNDSSEKSKYESASKSKVHLITIKSEGSHSGKRKHSENKDRKSKKEKRKKLEDYSAEILEKESERIEQEPSARVENDNDGFVEHKESTEDKKKKNRENEKKSHKKSHEKRHHKSSKHKEEKSHRDSKHLSECEYRSQHDLDDKCTDSHKHKRLKKSKVRDKEKNRGKKDRTTSEEFSEPEGNSASRDVNIHKSDKAAGDIFGAALLEIPVTASPKKKIASRSSSHQDSPPVSSSPKSSHSTNFLSNSVKLESFLSIDPGKLDIPLDISVDIAETYNTPSKYNNSKYDVSPKIHGYPQKSSGPKALSEEDMFSSMTLKKNQRTKVYHGFKVNSQIPTLFALCVRVLQDNFDALEYTGGVPYEVIKPILEKVTVEQLYTFENFNPYLIGETDLLWEHHAKKHFKKAERQEYETWRDLYLRCVEEREEKLHSVTENISQSMANSTPVRKTKLAYVDAIVKPPRNVARQQAKHGTGSNTATMKCSKEPYSVPSAVMSVKERLAKEASSPNAIQIPTKTVKKKAAPLMQKTLQLFKGLKR